jgi:hypothetical protein
MLEKLIFKQICEHIRIDAARKIFVNPMAGMNRIRPSKEEFVLLLAMLVSNPGWHKLL